MTRDPSRAAKAVALVLGFAAVGWLLSVHGVPTGSEVRALVGGAGGWAPVLYVVVFAALTLVAAPRNVLTTVGAALFGVSGGIASHGLPPSSEPSPGLRSAGCSAPEPVSA